MRVLSVALLLLALINLALAVSLPATAHSSSKHVAQQDTLITLITTTPSSAGTSWAQVDLGSSSPSSLPRLNKRKAPPTFVTPYILTTGTLFYIGVAISFALWCTGFALDFIMDRQEQLAFNMAMAKKHCVDMPSLPVTLKV